MFYANFIVDVHEVDRLPQKGTAVEGKLNAHYIFASRPGGGGEKLGPFECKLLVGRHNRCRDIGAEG